MLSAMLVFTLLVCAWGSRHVRAVAHDWTTSARRLVPEPDAAKVAARRERTAPARRVA